MRALAAAACCAADSGSVCKRFRLSLDAAACRAANSGIGMQTLRALGVSALQALAGRFGKVYACRFNDLQDGGITHAADFVIYFFANLFRIRIGGRFC